MKDLKMVINVLLVEKKDIILSIICGFIAGITAVALFSASGYLISKAALAPPIYTLMILVASVKMLGIISALSRYGERYYSHRGTFTMLSNLRVSFYEKIEPLAPGIFGKYRSGDLLARIVGDVEALQNFFLRVFYPPIVLLLIFFCTIFFTSFFSFEVALILFVGYLLTTVLVPSYFALRQRKIDRRVRGSRAELSTEVTEFLYGFRDLKIYQQLEGKQKQLSKSSAVYMQEQEQESVHNLFSQATNTFLSLMVTVCVLAIGAYLVVKGELDGIYLAMLVMVSLTVFENTTPMAIFPSHLQDSKLAASRLVSVVRNESAAIKMKKQENFQTDLSPKIEVKNVRFTYPNESRLTLENVSINLESGTKTAIVGPSGSGKSTLLQLMLNLYYVDEGEILLNNTPINDLLKESIWENTNVVLQTNHFFYGTIRDNLKLAKDGLNDYDMQEALAKVDLGHFKLDDSVLEKGENLSGGEKQRLAIARAMLKNAPLWLLDEPTSSVDALTEAEIYQHIFDIASEDTLVLVSHRLTGLEKMDQIIVMDHGKIIETGNFQSLMESKGYFYEMKMIEQNVFLGV
ncbi:thiol reductant ABC exporter subunit CydC [Oceanobacillus chungangensis]|uniref:Thiol reductant ABC exporter subunit CydC n=1 Tax=Oceanobacillus chungangensis TaxID=1229152 RepID=A0A3D8PUE8_9BACI|nr:thiol reductant ABC exporter subunit CydC [Oceanobacillus chungangensis]RDW19780.1 thiol reductant ABC exporter subunit CydC [Oceanobacillus chungangensis]